MGQTEGKVIDERHPDYADILQRWREEGCPDQFDRTGTFGGAIYNAHTTQEGKVHFFQRHSLGPTTIDEEGQVTKGWEFVNERGMRIEHREGREGQPEIRYIDAPNEI